MASASTTGVLAAVVTSSASRKDVPEDAAHLKHHLKDGKGFRNPWDSWTDKGGLEIMSEVIKRRFTHKRPTISPCPVEVVKPSFLPTRETKTLRATWLGHACYYIEFPTGLRVLFDPVFTERCSPFSFMGPKRYSKAPCQVEDIPFIDACVISHSHYDHMSVETIQQIQAKFPKVQFFAPLGIKQWFTASGIPNMTEWDWWQDCELRLSPEKDDEAIGGSRPAIVSPQTSVDATSKESTAPASGSASGEITATLSCLPAQHASARTLLDKNSTLWSSWSVTSGSKTVYFGGDTGYRSIPAEVSEEDTLVYTPEIHKKYPHCPAFKEIGRLRGPFDLALIPIGAYKPRYLFSAMHGNPFDAVAIFRDIKAKKAMGIHWATWELTEEEVLEPANLLKVALKSKGIAEEGVFDVCKIGESREFS